MASPKRGELDRLRREFAEVSEVAARLQEEQASKAIEFHGALQKEKELVGSLSDELAVARRACESAMERSAALEAAGRAVLAVALVEEGRLVCPQAYVEPLRELANAIRGSGD